jgi:hypothetical protein
METDQPSISSNPVVAAAATTTIEASSSKSIDASGDVVMTDIIIPPQTPAAASTTTVQKPTTPAAASTSTATSPLKRPFKILADLDSNTFKLYLDNTPQQQPLPPSTSSSPARVPSPNKQPPPQHHPASALDETISPIYGPPQIDENARIRDQFTPDERVVPISKYMMERTFSNLSSKWDRYGQPRKTPSWVSVKEVEEFAVPSDTKTDPSLSTSKFLRFLLHNTFVLRVSLARGWLFFFNPKSLELL